MHEPVSIPIRDLEAEPEAPASDGAARSVTDEIARRIVEVITLGASATLALLDEVHDDELRDLAAAGAGFLIEGMRARQRAWSGRAEPRCARGGSRPSAVPR
jgi:hypothetical protein